MERRRKYNRHYLQTMHTFLPPVLLVTQLSILLAFCSLFVLVDYAECIMTFPDDSGVYSLFPDEDLKTGRKRLRFDEETTIRNYRDGRGGRDYLIRSYPMLPQDRLHRPVDYDRGSSGGGNRPPYDDFRLRDRERHGRVYFDDSFRSSRFDFHRLTPRPRPIERPVSPIIFETSRRPPPLHHHHHHHRPPFVPENFPPGPPAIGQSKLPPGAVSRASGEDIPTRIHVFNPESNSFGNPRNAGAGSGENDGGPSSSERAKGPPSNFVETGPPGPESFFNHEEFLEYQKKIAFARFHEQDASGKGGGSSAGDGAAGKKVLFESKEPFEIDGLVPPDKSGENKDKLGTTSKQAHGQGGFSPSPTVAAGVAKEQKHLQILVQQQQQKQNDQRQLQRGEGQKVRGAGNHHRHNQNEETEEDTGGGEVESDIVSEKGDEVKSENGKSEVTQLPPTHITKSGRSRNRHQNSNSGDASSDHSGGGGGDNGSSAGGKSTNKKFTPSISHNEEGGGGTGFKLPTTPADRYSDEPPNLNGFVPVVPFHLIGPEQPRAISLERPRQQQQQRIVPHHHDYEAPVYSSTTASTSTTTARSITSTIRSIPVTTTIASTTARSKGEKLGFRPTTEVTKSYTSSSSPFTVVAPPDNGPENNAGNNPSGAGGLSYASSPASPILHATAGERSNSETHTKVAITKQQELKRLQKQRQLSSSMHNQHQLIIPPPPSHSSSSAGLFPDIGLGDSSASSDSADNSDNPGTFTNTNNGLILIASLENMVTPPHISTPTPPPLDMSVFPTVSSSTPTQHVPPPADTTHFIHNTTPPPTSPSPSTLAPKTFINQENAFDLVGYTEHKLAGNMPNTQIESENGSHQSKGSSSNNEKNDTHEVTVTQQSPSEHQQNTSALETQVPNSGHSEQEHSSEQNTLGGNATAMKSVVADSTANSNNNHNNNGLFDTRAVKIANGIKQGDFLLEGYMINSNDAGDGAPPAPFGPVRSNSLSSRSSATPPDADYTNHNHIQEENVGHRQLYDYPDPNEEDPLPILHHGTFVGTSSSPSLTLDDVDHSHENIIPLSPVIPLLPGTTTPDLEQNLTPPTATPYLFSSNPNSPTLSGDITSSSNADEGGSSSSSSTSSQQDVTGNEDISSSSREPNNNVEEDAPSRSSPHVAAAVLNENDNRNVVLVDGDDVVAFGDEPTPPPEQRQMRLSEIKREPNFAAVVADAPTNPFYGSSGANEINDNTNNEAYFPYYDTYGNKLNASRSNSGISSSSSSSAASSGRNQNSEDDDDDEIFSYSSSGEGAFNQFPDENGLFEKDEFNLATKRTFQRGRMRSLSSSSSSSHDKTSIINKHSDKNKAKFVKLKILESDANFVSGGPSSISVPVQASINYSNDGSSSIVRSSDISSNSIIEDVGDGSRRSAKKGNPAAAPLYLESSETLMNKTYYLDGMNYNHTTSKSSSGRNDDVANSILKSSNFIKVTRIKAVSSGHPSSPETVEKTTSAVVASSRGRSAKPAVIVGSSAAGARPKVVGSVVEAGPAWPGLVSNFLRQNGQYNNNRSFTATATVRPRGNSGTNPSPPSTVITGQVQQLTQAQLQHQIQQKQQQQLHHHRQQSPHTPPPPPQQLQQPRPSPPKATEFQLQQIRIPSVTSISSGTQNANNANNNNPSANNHHHNSNSSSIITRNGGGSSSTASANNNLAKQVNGKINANSSNYNGNSSSNHSSNNSSSINNDSKAHSVARRLYSSEEDSSSVQIRSNSSTGIVSLVHAHISHCPKLHSPTEVICDVHIREGHGVPNPQLTVGWRRKFYNSTQPDVLLALNKAPASGENGHFEPHHSVMEIDPGKNGERLEEFHDKFNVTLAPGISPMLRSVLLIRSVTAPDCGTYQCEVNDGINVLTSETLLFLCH